MNQVGKLIALAEAGEWEPLEAVLREIVGDRAVPDEGQEWLSLALTAVIAEEYDDVLQILGEAAALEPQTVEVKEERWRWTYRTSPDSKSCDVCLELDGAYEETEVGRMPTKFQAPNPDCKGRLGDNPCLCQVDFEVVDGEEEESSLKALAVKLLDDEGRIGAYAIRFGSAEEPDLSSKMDFFTPETEYWLAELGFLEGKACAPILYAHAMDETTALDPVVGTWTKAVLDDIGVWVEGQIDLAKKYSKWVKELIKKGVLKLSSDSASHLIRREEQANGTHKVLRWPILAASLTPTPAEPRLLPVELLGAAYKAVSGDFQKQMSDLEVKTMDEMTITKIADLVAAKVAVPPVQKDEVPAVKDINTEALVAAVADGVLLRLREQPALKEAGFLLPKPKSEGPFVAKLPHNFNEVKAFDMYLHFGLERLSDPVKSLLKFDRGVGREIEEEGVKAALNVTTGSQGGFLVPVEYSMELVKPLAELSHLRAARARQIKFPDTLSFKVEAQTFGAAAALTSEAAAFDEVEPTFADTTFTAYKATRLAKVSDELLEDSRFDIWSEILQPDWVQAFAAFENSYFTTGTGSSQPQGVVAGAGTGKTAASATAITADELKDLYYSLNHRYRESPSCAFMMNDAILQYIDKMKDGEGRYLVSGDLNRGEPKMLMGKPIIVNNSMASTIATTNKTILFGDFGYFWIADRSTKGADGRLNNTEIFVRRLNELYAANGQVGFRAYMRSDSHVMIAAAFKLLVQA